MNKVIVFNRESLFHKPFEISLLANFSHFEIHSVPSLNLVSRKANEFTPDILIYFCKYPQKITVEFLIKIKERFAKLKIILVSSSSNKRIVKEISSKLVDAYLVNTASYDELLNAIYAVMSNRNYVSNSVLNTLIEDANNPFKVRSNLSAREIEVLALMAQELPSKQIADKLNVSPHTIETNKRQLMKKLNVKSSVGLVKIALREGLVF